MQPISIPEKLGDLLRAMGTAIIDILQWNVQMPAFLSMWKEENIVKWKIGWMKVADAT